MSDTNERSCAASGSVGWIRVADELPPTGLEVLVAADGWMRIAYHTGDGWRMACRRELDTVKPPTHWMELPWHLPLP
jgi:hypothetical protein